MYSRFLGDFDLILISERSEGVREMIDFGKCSLAFQAVFRGTSSGLLHRIM